MAKVYAHVVNGIVQVIVDPAIIDGNEIPVSERFVPEIVDQLVDITAADPRPDQKWVYDGKEFAPPSASKEQLTYENQSRLQQLSNLASQQKSSLAYRISTIRDAIEIEEATQQEIEEISERESQLLLWKKYAIYLGRVTGQEGWPEKIDWPDQPEEGMDLSVSAVAKSSAAS